MGLPKTGTFAYVYLGGGARATVDAVGDAAADGGGGFPVAKLALYGLGAVATLVATSRISKAATQALENPSAEPLPSAGSSSEDDS